MLKFKCRKENRESSRNRIPYVTKTVLQIELTIKTIVLNRIILYFSKETDNNSKNEITTKSSQTNITRNNTNRNPNRMNPMSF